MLYHRIRYRQQLAILAQQVAAMPEYPICCEADGRYSIYIDSQQRLFESEAAARLEQLRARARWLANHGDAYSAEQRR